MTGEYVLVTGGGGYIGSHMAKLLVKEGFKPVVLDSFERGHRDAARYGIAIEGDFGDFSLVSWLIEEYGIYRIFHFAGLISVEESVSNPSRYYETNFYKTKVLIDAARQFSTPHIVFSSSAAVYGETNDEPISEDHPTLPTTPYGRSKLFVEGLLADYQRVGLVRYCSLRYFNAAGADPEGELGEAHDPETHLIPIALQVAARVRPQLYIYGSDYQTRDGTCIRDYVHVVDLCVAHLHAMRRLESGHEGELFNLGTGRGFSVQEIVESVKRVTCKDVPCTYKARRPGDPAVLVADPGKAVQTFNWSLRYSELDTIIAHAWSWVRSQLKKPSEERK
jgi:UDP-glucose 4-epimerase